MTNHFLFHAVFLGQILLISFYYPRQLLGKMGFVLENYPQDQYPKLYTKPAEHYRKAQKSFRILNRAILIAGLVLLAVLVNYPRSGEWDKAIATWYFLLQFFPFLLLDIKSFKEFRRMRKANTRGTRTAVLQRRGLFNFVSPALFAIAIITYVAYIFLIVHINQFDYPWFGGYTNIVAVTLLNLFFAGIVLWHVYGKKLNPHQAHEDRLQQTEIIAKALVFTSIAATLFISISIVLSALDLRHLQPAVQSLYFQLLAVLCLQVYRTDYINFEVYKNDAQVT